MPRKRHCQPEYAANNRRKLHPTLLVLAMGVVMAVLMSACSSGPTATAATTASGSATSTGASGVTVSAVTTGLSGITNTTGAAASTGPTSPTGIAGTSGTSGASGASGTTGGIINMKIDAREARKILDTNKGAVLLDVRTIEENRELRIPGSTLIPLPELANRLGELPKNASRPILVYCRSGNRSAQAAAILKQAGFPVVYDFGGIIDWPYETEKG